MTVNALRTKVLSWGRPGSEAFPEDVDELIEAVRAETQLVAVVIATFADGQGSEAAQVYERGADGAYRRVEWSMNDPRRVHDALSRAREYAKVPR